MNMPPVRPSPLRERWTLEPGVVFLNHGSFGACPRAVLEEQLAFRARIEAQPVRFFMREFEELLDAAREVLASFIGADPRGLAFVSNATSGINAVLRSLALREGDELIVTNHEYNACRNALDFVAERSGARVVQVDLPFPISGPGEVTERIVGAVTDRTRLALVDAVTSPTGLVLPIHDIVRELDAKGVDTLVDGAHAPGMLPLDLDGLGAAYFAGNAHKWLCTPKGAAMLWVREDRREEVRPTVISHGANTARADRSRYLVEFDWTGTQDPTPWLCIPAAIETMGALFEGGWDELRAHNRGLALEGRALLCEDLEIDLPCPDEMIGSLAAIPLPDAARDELPTSPLQPDPLQNALWERERIEVPVHRWPAPPARLIRISAQAYNSIGEYGLLAKALRTLL